MTGQPFTEVVLAKRYNGYRTSWLYNRVPLSSLQLTLNLSKDSGCQFKFNSLVVKGRHFRVCTLHFKMELLQPNPSPLVKSVQCCLLININQMVKDEGQTMTGLSSVTAS